METVINNVESRGTDAPFGFEPGAIITTRRATWSGPDSYRDVSASVMGWSSHGMVISEDGVELRIIPIAEVGKWRSVHPDYREELAS